jgi:hypothetical protein
MLDKRIDDWKPTVTNGNSVNLSPAEIPRWVGEECAKIQ